MRSKFDEQLKKLNEEMMHMGSMIEESIQKAIEAFIHQDADSAKAIMEGDSEIDREQKKIESLCFNLLMQQQPVARDLRTISAAMKMVTDMERIGDHAADISEMTILMSSDKPESWRPAQTPGAGFPPDALYETSRSGIVRCLKIHQRHPAPAVRQKPSAENRSFLGTPRGSASYESQSQSQCS